METTLSLIKVDNTLYLGEEYEGGIKNAVLVKGDLSSKLTKNAFAIYEQKANLGELLNITFGTQSAISKRELTEEEIMLDNQAQFAMKIAKTKALANLENEYLDKNF